MIKSMTAYSRVIKATPLGRFVLEIQSLNKKHLDIQTVLPREFLVFDCDIKKWVSSKVSRGHLVVRMSASFDRAAPFVLVPNIALARELKHGWDLIAQSLNMPPSESAFQELLAAQPELFLYEQNGAREEDFRLLIATLVNEALDQLSEMKKVEGRVLLTDLQERILHLADLVEQIFVKAPESAKRYHQRLKDKIAEVSLGSLEHEDKVLREVCIFADRMDISEEITRFRSHLQQVKTLLEGEDERIGKNLEFLLQELGREVNTMGAKSADIEISKAVLSIKMELERIREQIQNIE